MKSSTDQEMLYAYCGLIAVRKCKDVNFENEPIPVAVENIFFKSSL